MQSLFCDNRIGTNESDGGGDGFFFGWIHNVVTEEKYPKYIVLDSCVNSVLDTECSVYIVVSIQKKHE